MTHRTRMSDDEDADEEEEDEEEEDDEESDYATAEEEFGEPESRVEDAQMALFWLVCWSSDGTPWMCPYEEEDSDAASSLVGREGWYIWSCQQPTERPLPCLSRTFRTSTCAARST